MTTKYYKTADPEVIAAWAEYRRQVAEVQDAGEAFAKVFGATALFCNTVHGYEFSGITFKGEEPFMGRGIWTKPERSRLGRQHPLKRVPASLKEDSQKLKAMWGSSFPKQKAEREPLLNSVGLGWGDVVFGGGFEFFEIDGVAYFKTAAQLKDTRPVTEITGSEYEERHAAHQLG